MYSSKLRYKFRSKQIQSNQPHTNFYLPPIKQIYARLPRFMLHNNFIVL
uniref:Uncharacterized protein n=1 Tax=Rhizophora mucronata TaxID=61149 RepID=A0A2P2QEY4_RHIMU